MRNNVPDLRTLQSFAVNRQGQYEVVRQTLYDRQTYPTAGLTQLLFFQNPKGTGGRTAADTNVEVAGSLPQPKWLLVESIEIHLFPGVVPSTAGDGATPSEFINDVYSVLSGQAFLNFFIGSKTYVEEAPLIRFPPKTRLYAESAVANGDTVATSLTIDYAAACGRPYFIDPEVLLIPNQNFNVSVNFPTAIPTPSGADAAIEVVLDGILYRQSQ
jgi:hypothetical protein